MRRSLVILAAVCALAAVVTSGTFAGYSTTQANSASLSTQAVLPPVNKVLPSITSTLGVALSSIPAGGTVVQGRVGTWATVNTPSYAVTWQRFSGGNWSDVQGPTSAVDLGGGILGDLFTIPLVDPGTPIRIKVVATDPFASPTGSTTAFSDQVG